MIPLVAVTLFCVIGCGEDRTRIPADAPGYIDGKAVHPSIKIGRPYRIKGKKYYPEYEPDYDETGIASWYGPNFHGKATANGEEYNQWAMTAAHTTLPMPSMVKVTALDTGRSTIVRINDRGPFANGRIIDLSRAAAEELGVRAKGIAKVRVQYLKEETEQYIARLQLKKPKSWREADIQLAKARPAVQAPAPIVPPVQPQADEQGISHTIEVASTVPDHFAYEAPGPITTTIDERGVTMEEFGYAEDAFSVLDDMDFDVDEQPSMRTASYQPKSAPMPVASGTGKEWFVRAGTFSNKDNAYNLADKVKSIAPVTVTPLTIGQKAFWKVSLGPAFNRGIAGEIKQRLAEYNIRDAVIVSE